MTIIAIQKTEIGASNENIKINNVLNKNVGRFKGKNIPSCGFVQYQYSQKVEQGKKFQRLSKVKIVKNLQKYLVAKESKILQKADLSWKCESYFHH